MTPAIGPDANWPQSVSQPHPPAQPVLVPATTGDRFVARLIDSGVVLGSLMVLGLCNSAVENSAKPLSTLLGLVALAVLYGYEFVMLGLRGQTLGKRTMKLRVARLDGTPIGWGSAAARAFVPTVASCLSCGLGGLLFYLSPLFDSGPWKRGWHDMIASTVVVRVPPSP